ncbi:type I restriction enzyme M protein [Trichlorobacter thiogenes]|uniref:Type I restriction enzyme M protein n=1 Tax=Trichlorobacter thiogenes TaxID=115783 RepID=A0A1T4RWL8_9BACT|nr:hypothetical protein [Trichlorobacter thiogenes]SKA20345.1 type I restriction enzyme M protein [Trichlorobacter thiogenes]
MTFSLAELLKDSAYKLTQFNATPIQALEAAISLKVTEKSTAPYATEMVIREI